MLETSKSETEKELATKHSQLQEHEKLKTDAFGIQARELVDLQLDSQEVSDQHSDLKQQLTESVRVSSYKHMALEQLEAEHSAQYAALLSEADAHASLKDAHGNLSTELETYQKQIDEVTKLCAEHKKNHQSTADALAALNSKHTMFENVLVDRKNVTGSSLAIHAQKKILALEADERKHRADKHEQAVQFHKSAIDTYQEEIMSMHLEKGKLLMEAAQSFQQRDELSQLAVKHGALQEQNIAISRDLNLMSAMNDNPRQR